MYTCVHKADCGIQLGVVAGQHERAFVKVIFAFRFEMRLTGLPLFGVHVEFRVERVVNTKIQ